MCLLDQTQNVSTGKVEVELCMNATEPGWVEGRWHGLALWVEDGQDRMWPGPEPVHKGSGYGLALREEGGMAQCCGEKWAQPSPKLEAWREGCLL